MIRLGPRTVLALALLGLAAIIAAGILLTLGRAWGLEPDRADEEDPPRP